MSPTEPSSVIRNIASKIRASKSEITIVFTDIVKSTAYWDKHGDVAGRLMVDRHNRLLFKVIHTYGGNVRKTMGDSIMATFRSPGKAVLAAIGMQQILEKHRREDPDLGDVKVRIGVHTGMAIVESDDVFGDAVNVAARVEAKAKADEILVTGACVKHIASPGRDYSLKKAGSFQPKGKARSVSLHRCDWRKHDSLLEKVERAVLLPLAKRQKFELLAYLVVFAVGAGVFHQTIARYLLADYDAVALAMAFPSPWQYVGALTAAATLTAASAIWLLRQRPIPLWLLRLVKGGHGAALCFLLVFFGARAVDMDLGAYWDSVLYRSEHSFARVLVDDVNIRRRPSVRSRPVATARAESLLLVEATLERRTHAWLRVALPGEPDHGFVRTQMEARVGVPAKPLVEETRLEVRYTDLYALGAGLLGLLWGILTFKIRPL